LVIDRDEIEAKAAEFGIHPSNVQRDYVFGWLLYGLYSGSPLAEALVLKGGNGIRKAYFPNTRFSRDLDFATERHVDELLLQEQFNQVCAIAQAASGVTFDLERNNVRLQQEIDATRRQFEVRIYFKDFYGNSEKFTISVSVDVTEFDRIYLPPQKRLLIHPYSDAGSCRVEMRCLKLEEMLAAKLKCLLQRREVSDLYDLVYSIFINRDLDVIRSEVASTFLRKTIFQPSPGVARQLLLDLPLTLLRTAWERYIIVPVQSVLDFDWSIQQFQSFVSELFRPFGEPAYGRFAFFPSHLRTPILEAGQGLRLLSLTYDGVRRIVEPYSLVFKRRKDGYGQEYFYVYDRTGGRSGPGIKALLNTKVEGLELTDETFTPRYAVELSKAGEHSGSGYFARPFRRGAGRINRPRTPGWVYVVQCSYCNRRFRRRQRNIRIAKHNDSYGNPCYGRSGYIVDQNYES
jgi:predicted nucleotidyltransferase component of viral defense system